MKVLVDTSVWVDFFNGYESQQAEDLAALIRNENEIATCGVIMAEFFQGIRKRKSLELLIPYFRDMTYLTPQDPDSYLTAADLYRRLRGEGVTIRSTIDCLIAILAAENNAYILAKDIDFVRMFEFQGCPARPLPAL